MNLVSGPSVSHFCVEVSGWLVFRAAQGVSALLADVAAVGVGSLVTCPMVGRAGKCLGVWWKKKGED